ncbi:serine hydrolase domain-containing protein [Lacisediminihabitans sp.]|uniref:serine hydrolase domain-containing protein n=1 Tax=Lacisediminihabitans sp. TaxID=2787631 RepID=UPI00374D0F1F
MLGIGTSRGIEAIEAFGASGERVARSDDHFALFSVTKPLVGLAALRAVRAGSLALGDALDESALPGVTLEHLLSHRSGLVDVPLDSPVPLGDQLASATADYAPGAAFRYTNLAFAGVGAMLERSTGRTVYDHIDHYLGPGAGVGFDPGVDPHDVYGTDGVDLDLSRMYGHRHPAAGAFGTAAGLLGLGGRVLRTLRDGAGELLDPALLRGALVSRTTGLGEPDPAATRSSEYGLSGNLREHSPELANRRVFGHAGWSGSQWWIYPEQDVVLVLLTNHLQAGDLGVDFSELNNALFPASVA